MTNIEIPMTRIVCFQLKAHALTMPIEIRIHFHGSVIHTKRGIHDANMVTPEE
ncbi:MAG: hypothetical protein JRJ13_13435 [Deltaproteobacteria bacterium]|nr:hypothetical protein [Deltaproteobacteria bacterium]